MPLLLSCPQAIKATVCVWGGVKQTHDTYNSVPGLWLATFYKLLGELL